ncbi:hypothetical protein P8936_17190 [Edaphobacter paludis]|uniref:Uncharacterized protein n=1 Tax=Edaphobacter paludis TaxID=3035702 RepID=A0AAU7D844_9BACT
MKETRPGIMLGLVFRVQLQRSYPDAAIIVPGGVGVDRVTE